MLDLWSPDVAEAYQDWLDYQAEHGLEHDLEMGNSPSWENMLRKLARIFPEAVMPEALRAPASPLAPHPHPAVSSVAARNVPKNSRRGNCPILK